jgi:hypothetical protein
MSRRKRVLVAGIAALALLGAAGGVLAATMVGSGPSIDALSSATRDAPMVRLADIPASNGLPLRGVFAQMTPIGQFCLWDAPSASSRAKGGGCNPADDPLGGHPLSASFAYDGGPAPGEVTDARLIGLVASKVGLVEVAMSDGSRVKLTLRQVPESVGDFRVFAHRFSRGELKRGIAPTAVVALDANGSEIDRQATGF